MATPAKRGAKTKRKAAPSALHKERFPGESRGYRVARNALLKAEIELRRKIESVAAQRLNLVVVAKSPIQRIRAIARERGWRNLRLLSSAGNSYNRDYHGEDEEGSQLPALNVFTRRGGRIYHAYCTELLFAAPDPGQNARHVDAIWPLWNLFDTTPEGRGTDWYPKLAYTT